LFLTDTHTHLYSSEFDTDRKQVVERAIAAGVTKFYLPNIDVYSVHEMMELCKQFPKNCYQMIGLHPTSVKENYERELSVLYNYLDNEVFWAIGEIGIDLYWDKTFLTQQQAAFQTQITWAKELLLPIVIHSRNSFDEIIEILEKNKDEKLRGIFHCFSGSKEQAEKAISLGFKLGLGGVLTYKNSGLDKAIADIDMKHLVLETDSPYLTPVPHRGKRNESGYITLVAQKLAEIKNISVDEVAEITTANAVEVFGI
jgi:TatD DNase family protein